MSSPPALYPIASTQLDSHLEESLVARISRLLKAHPPRTMAPLGPDGPRRSAHAAPSLHPVTTPPSCPPHPRTTHRLPWVPVSTPDGQPPNCERMAHVRREMLHAVTPIIGQSGDWGRGLLRWDSQHITGGYGRTTSLTLVNLTSPL